MSYPVNSAFSVDNRANASYQIDAVDLYEYPADDTITPLKTCALNCEIRTVEAPLSSGDQFVFDTNISPHQYLSNDVKLYFTIPFIVTLKEDSEEVITKENFIKQVFNNNSDIVYSQYSILQALQSNDISLNDQSLGGTNNISDCFNIVSPYYASDDVDQWFQASQPDRYQNFDKYTAGSDKEKIITYINEVGSTVYSSLSPVNDSNIFGSTTQSKYVTRTPEWEWVGPLPEGAKKGCKVKCTFSTWVPLSLFGSSDVPTGLAGIKRLTINSRFKGSAASYLFNIKKSAGKAQADPWDYRYSDIKIDNTSFMNSTAKMILRIMTPPQYMRDAMIDKQTGLLKPYSVSYPRILTHVLDSYQVIVASETKDFARSNIQTNSVPTSLYIAIVKKKSGNFTECASTPINFGLIKNLTIKVDSAVTNFNNIMSLAAIADSNGYDQLDPIGRLIKGFPIKIDVSKDLSLPGDTVVGATGTFNVSVEGNFINQGDTVADYQLVVVVVNNASLNFDGANFTVTSGAMVPSEVLNEKHFLATEYSKMTRSAKVVGGGFFGDAAKWVKKNAIKAWNNREAIAKTAGDVMALAKTIRGGSQLPKSNVSGAGSTRTLGAGDVKRNVFK